MSTRAGWWDQASWLIQDLLKSLYGSRENFINTPIISPLEPYILDFDRHMDDEGIVRLIAFRIGLDIPLYQEAAVWLYWYLQQVIDTFGLTKPHQHLPSLEEIINMTRTEYHQWMQRQGDQVYVYPNDLGGYYDNQDLRTTDTYHQRLIIFLNYYRQGLF